MDRVTAQLRIDLAEDGADLERIDLMTRRLRAELRDLGADVTAPPAPGSAPDGTRGADLADIGSLLVNLKDAAIGLVPVVGAIRQWLSRGHDVKRTVRLQIDGDVLELSHASEADQARVIDAFVSRHRR